LRGGIGIMVGGFAAVSQFVRVVDAFRARRDFADRAAPVGPGRPVDHRQAQRRSDAVTHDWAGLKHQSSGEQNKRHQ
jgi:hypothetical protein